MPNDTAKQQRMTTLCWQEPGAAAVQAAKLAELCHSEGRLEAAEALYERSGHAWKALQMWLGGRQWSQAHAAAVRQKLSQQQMQVMRPAHTVLDNIDAADLHHAACNVQLCLGVLPGCVRACTVW